MVTTCPPVLRRLLFLAIAAGVATGVPAQAQDSTTVPALGIRGIGAVGFHVGYARVERGIDATEVGGTLDLGHFASRRIRLGADVSFLRSLPHREFVVAEDTTYRNHIYDLTGLVTLTGTLRDPSRQVVPFLSVGAGVHALTSSFGSIPIDLRYNTNVLGLRAGGGVRVRWGRSRRRAIVLEGDASLAREVSRGSVRLGTESLFGDLGRR